MKVLKVIFTLFIILFTPYSLMAETGKNTSEVISKLKESATKKQPTVHVAGGITEFITKDAANNQQPNAMTMFKGLAFCLGIFFIGVALYQKIYRRSGISVKGTKRRMYVVERLQLTPKTSLMLVEYEGRRVLLSVGSEQVSFIPEEDKKLPHFKELLDAVDDERLSA